MDQRMHITQGEQAVATGADTMISTLLGSCVACCLWDPEAGVGGMNHMLLPSSSGQSHIDAMASINDIELLINAIIKRGGDRYRLQAKAFGGASMVAGLSDIGQKNAQFTLDYLQREGIPVVTQSLGGTMARNIRFWPATGKAQQRLTENSVVEKEVRAPVVEGNDVDLF